MSIFGSKDKSGNLSCNFSHIDGLQGYSSGIAVNLTQEETMVSIAKRLSKEQPIYLPYTQISAVDVVSENDVTEKNKSVVGRAAVGGILLGPLGAIVGGMSGVGAKKKNEKKYYFVINYRSSSAPEETKVISFEIVGASLHWDKFTKALRTKIPKQELQPASQYL